MQSISFKRLVSLGFLGPTLIILGAIASVVLRHGQAVMLPSTVAAMMFYGALIAVGVGCRDGIPRLFESRPMCFVVLGVVTLALAAAVWLAVAQEASSLSWRPMLTAGVCLWIGVVLASFIPQRVRS